MSEKGSPSHCKGNNRPCKQRHRWVRWTLPITGLAALIWFLIRVVPKPSRAAYPCQWAGCSLPRMDRRMTLNSGSSNKTTAIQAMTGAIQ